MVFQALGVQRASNPLSELGGVGPDQQLLRAGDFAEGLIPNNCETKGGVRHDASR